MGITIDNNLGYIIGFLGILATWYFYKKGIETKELKSCFVTYRDIEGISSEEKSNIKVYYKSEEVKQVYTTYIWIWNNGKRPIIKSDLVSKEGVILKIENNEEPSKLLDYRIIKISREEIGIDISRQSINALKIGFEFLDYKDGFVLEIQHTGDYNTQIELQGIILGITKKIRPRPLGVENEQRIRKEEIIYKSKDMKSSREFIRKPPFLKVKDTISIITFFMIFLLIIYGISLIVSNKTISINEEKLYEILVNGYNVNDINKNYSPQQLAKNQIRVIKKAVKPEFFEKNFVHIFAGLFILIIILTWMSDRYPFPESLCFNIKSINKELE